MTAPLGRTLSSLAAVVLTAACTSYYEIPIETPIRPKLDVSAFQRVFVAGFVSGGTEDVDGNLETTRLLRSQLRSAQCGDQQHSRRATEHALQYSGKPEAGSRKREAT